MYDTFSEHDVFLHVLQACVFTHTEKRGSLLQHCKLSKVRDVRKIHVSLSEKVCKRLKDIPYFEKQTM
jgi:hypothetical protein